MIKKVAITLAAALMIASTGCGNDSKSPILTYVARNTSDFTPNLFTLNEATQTPTPVAISIPSGAATVSPNADATKVVYARDGDSGWDIFTIGTDGVEHQLTNGADAWAPVFSPDGKTIAFMSYVNNNNYQVYTMGADGSNPTPVYADSSLEEDFPVFAADGKSLVFAIWTGCSCDLASRHAILSRASHQSPHALKSKHAPHANTSGITQGGFYKMALSDSAPTLVYATNEWWGPATLTADGTGILITMYDGTQDNIFRVNLDGSSLTPLTTGTDVESFSPVPYKGLILFNVYNSDNTSVDIYVMDQSGANQALVHSTTNTYELLTDAYWGD